jgi:hypothetical protein
MIHKPFILLLGVLLGGHGPALAQTVAQTPAPRIVLAQEHVAPITPMLSMVTSLLPAASFLLSQEPGKPNAHLSLLSARAYARDYSLEHLSPMDDVRTLILTQSSLPLVRLWGGRLQLDAFQSTLHLQNVPFGIGGMRESRFSSQSYPGGPHSIHLSGLSLSFHFGRDARTGHPAQLWRRLTRTVVAALN